MFFRVIFPTKSAWHFCIRVRNAKAVDEWRKRCWRTYNLVLRDHYFILNAFYMSGISLFSEIQVSIWRVFLRALWFPSFSFDLKNSVQVWGQTKTCSLIEKEFLMRVTKSGNPIRTWTFKNEYVWLFPEHWLKRIEHSPSLLPCYRVFAHITYFKWVL